MRIGVISDTHGDVSRTKLAVACLEKQDVTQVIHCGDVGSPGIVALLQSWPTHFVAGNCDSAMILEQEVTAAGQTWHGQFGDISLGERRIAVLHSHISGKLEQTVQSHQYDLVCYGHTHRYETHTAGPTTVLNPGAIHRAATHTVAVVDLDTMQVEYLKIG